MELNDKTVLILGLGASGLAMAKWADRLGASVVVADTREAPPQLEALRAALPQAHFISCEFSGELLVQHPVRMVAKSPGLTPAEVRDLIATATQQGIPVCGELDWFMSGLQAEHLKALQAQQEALDAAQQLAAEEKNAALEAAASSRELGSENAATEQTDAMAAEEEQGTEWVAAPIEPKGYRPAVLAITGTNGKTTVTSLTAKLIAASGWSVAVAGNIGPSMLETLAEAIDTGALPQAWVLELSSFQLQDAQPHDFSAATVLNVTEDHLDWHADIAEYSAAKGRIFGPANAKCLMVLNRDDPSSTAFKLAPPTKPVKGHVPRRTIGFGLGAPTQAGDFGIDAAGGMDWLAQAVSADETRKRSKLVQEQEIYLKRFLPAGALRIAGRHNTSNALAALALATSTGASVAPMLFALREYRGEPHRVESVAIVNGVEFFNDSKGTNVGATVAAIRGLAERRLVVILGGEGKGQDFSPLAAPITDHARAVVLIGRDAALLEKALERTTDLHRASNMQDAVQTAARLAREGDAVLLSPACASFDMFKNYEHRGEMFAQSVRTYAQEQGVPL